MSLLKISEPNETLANVAFEKKKVAGIDLGTTNSLIGTVSENGVELFDDENGVYIVKSAVRYNRDKSPVVGDISISSKFDNDSTLVYSVKD